MTVESIPKDYLIEIRNGKPILCLPDQMQAPSDIFPVPSGYRYVFTFEIAPGPAQATLRFKEPGDPPPDEPVTWLQPPPPSIRVVPAADGGAAQKTLVIEAVNVGGLPQDLPVGFNLNLYDEGNGSSVPVYAVQPDGSWTVDPTIVEKAEEPP